MSDSVNKQWARKFASDLVLQIAQICSGQEDRRKLPPQDSRMISSMFLSHYVGQMLYKELTRPLPESITPEEAYKITYHNFAELKKDFEESVAAGFQAALSQYSGKPVEYVCQVTPVPEAPTKLVC